MEMISIALKEKNEEKEEEKEKHSKKILIFLLECQQIFEN
jgi:hypothetical protein